VNKTPFSRSSRAFLTIARKRVQVRVPPGPLDYFTGGIKRMLDLKLSALDFRDIEDVAGLNPLASSTEVDHYR
jgi:hypothetical protein